MLENKGRFHLLRLTVLFLFILLQFYLIFVKKHDALDLDIAPNKDPTPPIYGIYQIGQTFIAKRDGLARIDIMLGTHGRRNTGSLRFRLWELGTPRQQRADLTIEASEVKNNLYHALRFPPISDSRDKTYYFLLAAPQASPDNCLSAWMNDQNIYREGTYWFRDREAEGDLIFRVYSKRPVFTELGRIVRNYSGVFGSRTVLVFTIILFETAQVIMLWWLLGFIFRSREKE
jgi:hypothetical protein